MFEPIIEFLRVLILTPLGIMVVFIMGLSDSPRNNFPKTEKDIDRETSFLARKPEECVKLAEKGYETDNCYYSVAMWTSDIHNCSKILDLNFKDKCIQDTISGCDFITEPDFADYCYSRVSSFYSEKKWCEKIINPINREKCLFSN
jgi:hypothetical protein